ncbi:protein FAR1-RELATED SEQUENCE 5-like isoform X1 [Papaver somniferum]|uniref:protein FAR1-RELATED SEQUENCE 5-like isoform X1 n=1 Tax=Papaver somniferum TaxID=3469 RepID=UPI000E6F49B4|nr:protein FAR1-RELATED SEQUENCE 5-like isoform X1 [Papaver somniferum]
MENPSFFYSIQVDSEGQMTNFFWADAKSRMDYYYFGDVVCFDPTYSTNKYDMPFVPIVGVNHHYQTVLFGGALLYYESEDSFEWVMKTWMRAMHGKAPKVILTDQESAIGGAIAHVLPGTRHRYCLWHICRNAMKNLSNVSKEFVSEFNNCLYGYETVEQFELGWATMLKNHNLDKNKWLSTLYNKREHWASVYTRNVFCADMYTTQRSESINSYFDGFLRRDMPLCEFVRQYVRAVVARREAKNNMDYETIYTKPVLRFRMCIEEDATLVYTKIIFTKFQEQLTECFSYSHERVNKSGTLSTYQVSRVGYAHKHRTVIFDSFNKSAQCSCLLYEFAGYLCRHILKVFVVENVQNLPTQHVLKRWTKDAKFGPVVFDQGEEIVVDCQDMVTVRYNKLCQDAINIAVKGSTSISVYNVAVQALHKALKEIEEAIKSSQVNPDGQPDVTQYEDITRQEEIVENRPNFRRPLKEPLIVKRKGKPGRRKSWVDALNRKPKNKETKGKRGSGSSPRLPAVELEIANSQDKQPRKRKKNKSVALVNTNSQDKNKRKEKKSSNKGSFTEISSHQPENADIRHQPNEIDLNIDLTGHSWVIFFSYI